MESANIFLFEPSEHVRLFIRKALQDTPYRIINEATTSQEAIGLLDLSSRGSFPNLLLLSELLPPESGAKGAKHVVDHTRRVEKDRQLAPPAKIIGMYAVKQLRMHRIKVTTDISRNDIWNNPANLRDLIAEI